jgi:hypothetical protein
MATCAKCGVEADDTGKFCRNCGARMQPQDTEATTWRLQPNTGPGGDRPATAPVRPGNTGQPSPATGPAYMPPSDAYQPLQQYPQAPLEANPRPVSISVGDWLYGGWRLYSGNWALMTVAALLGAFISLCTIGILAGPLLMGLFRMAFKAMKQETPEMSDLFNWEGKFLPAVLAFFIFVVLWYAVSGLGSGHELFWLLSFVFHPLLNIGLSLTIPRMSEGRADLADAINSVARRIFSKDALMWWVVGLAFTIIGYAGLVACGVGIFVTFPWMICAAAVAYESIYGIDDPNRTLR